MAPSEVSKLFQKLRLDTSNHPKPAPSEPHPTPQHGLIHSALHGDSQDYFKPEDDEQKSDEDEPTDSVFSQQGGDSISNGHPIPGHEPPLSEIESSFRKRRTSISFAPTAKVDGVGEVDINESLPKRETRQRGRGRSMLQEIRDRDQDRTQSESQTDQYDAQTGQRLNGVHIDDLARKPHGTEDDRVASLTSETTASPTLEEARTPDESEFLLSPLAASSPIAFSSNSLPFGQRPGSQRSRSYRSSTNGSLRRISRRTSARSPGSSKSPASAFLSMWSARDEEKTPDPDEEGQEIDESGYIIGGQVGMGGFSVVKEVFALENGQKVKRAVKIVRKQVSGKDEFENDKLQTEFEHEVSIWRFLKHRNILPLLAVYDSEFATFCITKFNVGGTLFDLVHSRRQKGEGGLPAALAKRYAYQLASAIQYLHEEIRVVHRDIKLENTLLDMSGETADIDGGDVLLCDFGMADYIYNEHRASPEDYDETHNGTIGPSQTSTSVTGSLRYAAPELFAKNGRQIYSTAADMWAYGNVLYALLTNRLAFDDPFEPRVVMSILAAEWDEGPLLNAPAVKEEDASDLIDIVKGCMEKEPMHRWTVSEVIESEWMDGCSDLYDTAYCDWVPEE